LFNLDGFTGVLSDQQTLSWPYTHVREGGESLLRWLKFWLLVICQYRPARESGAMVIRGQTRDLKTLLGNDGSEAFPTTHRNPHFLISFSQSLEPYLLCFLM